MKVRTNANVTTVKLAVFAVLATMCRAATDTNCGGWRGEDVALVRFHREYDGKALRRLPSWLVPDPLFCTLTNDELGTGGADITRRIFELVRDRCDVNVLAYSPRCRLDLSSPEFMRRVKDAVCFFRGSDVDLLIHIDPRLFRNEYLALYPDDCLHWRQFAVARPELDGTVRFRIEQERMWDHTCYGSKDLFSWWKPGRIVSCRAVKDGADPSAARIVEAEDVTCATNFVSGIVHGLDACETLLVEADFPLKEVDPCSPGLLPFVRTMTLRYKVLGIDGIYMDEWGFQKPAAAMLDHLAFWYSPHFAREYVARSGGRDLDRDISLFALGRNTPDVRAAMSAYIRTIYDTCTKIERYYYDLIKEQFGDDSYIGKHPTWWSELGNAREVFHNGLDWWAAPRDWANTDENVSVSVATALAKKFGSPFWLNEGYGTTPGHYKKTLWRSALCGGRMSWHGITGDKKADYLQRKYKYSERRYARMADMFPDETLRAEQILRLLPLVSRAPIDCPVAHIFGYDHFVDWLNPAHGDWGKGIAHGLGQLGYYADAYPASEIDACTFAVDDDGYIRVGRQRYSAAILYNLSVRENAVWKRFTEMHEVKTRVFVNPKVGDVAAYLDSIGAMKQTPLGANGFWGGTVNLLPPSDGVVRLTDGTVAHIKGGHPDFAGDTVEGELVSGGVSVKYKARGLFAVRAANGALTGMAGGEVSRIEAPGISLSLAKPADIALVKLSDGWHGVWQTADLDAPVPAELLKLVSHWIMVKGRHK